MNRTTFRRTAVSIVSVATVLLTAGCGTSGSSTGVGSTSGGATSSTSAATSRTTYPVTVADCNGRQTTYTQAPKRVVTFDDNITETLLSLGLADRIVGITKFDTPSSEWAETKAQMDTLNVINKTGTLESGYPSKETVLAQSPDLVTSVYESAFDAAYGPGTHASWSTLHVNSFQTLQDCEANKAQSDFSLLFDDIRKFIERPRLYGVLILPPLSENDSFAAQDRAASLIARLQAKVTDLQAQVKTAGLSNYRVGMHDGEKEHPGTMGITTANAIIVQAGSTYAFLNDDHGSQPVSWETFVARDPQVIWVITDLGQTAKQTETQLETDPRTKSVDAVAHKRYVVVSYNDAVGSPRCIDGLQHMVEGLLALKKQGLL